MRLIPLSVAALGGGVAGALLTAIVLPGAQAETASTNPAAQAAAPYTRLAMPRVKPLEPAAWTDAHRQLATGDQAPNVLKVCMRNLEMCRAWFPSISFWPGDHTRLVLRDKEILTMRIAWRAHDDYAWSAHVPRARRAGLSDEEMLRITRGPGAAGWSEADGALLRAADELHGNQFITEVTWKTLAQRYDERELMEIVVLSGSYVVLAMFNNSLGTPLQANAVPLGSTK